MLKLKLPDNEIDRLKALNSYRVLDTVPEQTYDDIVFLASQICEVPMASVTLVDSRRQWFKAKIGIDFSETERELSFCSHAILSPDETTIISDTLKDDRFYDHPMVVSEPNIRFYAGAPLVTPEGYAVGTLCALDSKPKQLTLLQKNALAVLSRQIVAQLELRLKIAQLEEMERRLRHLTVRDDLTNLYNRRGFFANAEQLIKLARRTKSPISLIFIDVDGLKQVNDTYGHDFGSEMIVETANILRETFRDSDVVARLGGDEFAVFLVNSSQNYIEKVIDRLNTRMQNFNKSAVKPYKLSCSIGHAGTSDLKNLEIKDLLEKADHAMYVEKRRKKAAIVRS